MKQVAPPAASSHKLEFQRMIYADVNTGYLPESDMPLLLDPAAPMNIAVLVGDYGAIFYVPEAGPALQYQIRKAQQMGFSQRFCDLLVELSGQGYDYVRFEVEGGLMQGLQMLQEKTMESLTRFRPVDVMPEPEPEPEPVIS